MLVTLGIDPAAAAGDEREAVSAEAARLLKSIGRAPGTPEALGARLALKPARLQALIAELELAGAIVRESTGRWWMCKDGRDLVSILCTNTATRRRTHGFHASRSALCV